MRRLTASTALAAVLLVTSCTGGGSTPHQAGSPTTTAGAGRSKVLPVRVVLPRIERFVERERGLRFKHPVKAEVLGRKAFLAKFHATQKPPKASDVEKQRALLTSLGLVSPRVDLVKAFRTALDVGTLGFYDFKSKRLYVKGRRATPGVRAVLSHELTHALTDQWFGLRRPRLARSHQELGLGFTALTEGDAERTRKAYEATMSSADRALAAREENAGGTPHVPRIVLVFIGFPYVIGPQFVDAVVNRGGIAALNAAYRHPPTSSEQLLDPPAYFAHDDPKHVAVPQADGPLLDKGDLGLIGLLLMLEHGLDRTTAQQAVLHWGGDQYADWRAGTNRWCLRDTVVMDDPDATSRFETALAQWAATTHGRATVEHSGADGATFRACSS